MTSAKLWCGISRLRQTNIVMNIHFHIRKHPLCGLGSASLSSPWPRASKWVFEQIRKYLNLSTTALYDVRQRREEREEIKLCIEPWSRTRARYILLSLVKAGCLALRSQTSGSLGHGTIMLT